MDESLKEKILALFNLEERSDLELAVCIFNPMYIITNYGDVVSRFRDKIRTEYQRKILVRFNVPREIIRSAPRSSISKRNG